MCNIGCRICSDEHELQEYWGPLSGVAWKISADEVCVQPLDVLKHASQSLAQARHVLELRNDFAPARVHALKL